MKKLISIILAVMLAVFSAIPSFATETDLITEKEYNKFLDFVDACDYSFVNPEFVAPKSYPDWTDASVERMAAAIVYARERTITTVSELEDAYADLAEATSMMYVDKDELKFMYYLFIQEKNEDDYYDEKTWDEFQQLITDAKEAYYGDDEKLVHHIYIKMRNTYDDLCAYNTVYGDFNGDGVLNVNDITYAQKYLVDLVDFNSSQKMLSNIEGEDVSGLSITAVTYMQKYISGLATEFGNTRLDVIVSADELIEGYNIDPSTHDYIFQSDENIIYSVTYSWYYNPLNKIYNTFEV